MKMRAEQRQFGESNHENQVGGLFQDVCTDKEDAGGMNGMIRELRVKCV